MPETRLPSRVSDDYRQRCISALDNASGGLPLTREMAVDAMLDVRDEELEQLREENAYCREALKGAENRRLMWRERAEPAAVDLDENMGVMQALRRQRDTSETQRKRK